MKEPKPTARAFKIFALVVIILLILVFVVVPLLVTYLVDLDGYRPEIISKIEEETGKEVEIGKLSLSLIGGVRLKASDFALKDPKIPDKNILSTPSVTAKVSLVRLLKSELGIKKVVLKGAVFNIVRYRDGSLNIAGAGAIHRYRRYWGVPEWERDFSPPTGGYEVVPAALPLREGAKGLLKIKRVFIRSIEIEGGRFVYSAEGAGTKTRKLVELSGIDLDVASIRLPTGFTGAENLFKSDELEGKIEGEIEGALFYETRVSNVNFSCSVKGGESVVKNLVFSIYGGIVGAKGVLRHAAEEPSGKLSIEGSGIRFHELLNSLSDEENLIVGTLKLDGDFTFPLKKGMGFTHGLVGKGNVSVTDGTVPDFSIRKELAKSLKIPPAALPAELDTGDFSYMGGGYYIKSGKLFTDDFKTVGPSYNSTARGFLAFDGILNFSGYIYPSEDIVKSSLFEKLTSQIGIGGKLDKIPFTVTGTLDNVKFKIEYEGLFDSGSGGSKNLKDLGKSILENILK